MKPLMVLIVSLLAGSPDVWGQNEKWIVKADAETRNLIPSEARYRYDQFLPGTVVFKDNAFSKVRLNLNLVSGEMQFINQQNDTMNIAEPENIRHISISADTFFVQTGYLQLICSNGNLKLAKTEKLQLADMRKLNSKGKPDFIGNLSIISSINDRGNINKLSENVEMTLVKRTVYWIGDAHNHFVFATKKNVFKILGRYESLLNTYFAAHNIRFDNEADLMQLTEWIGKQ